MAAFKKRAAHSMWPNTLELDCVLFYFHLFHDAFSTTGYIALDD